MLRPARYLAVSIASLLAGCTTITPPPTPESARIEVEVDDDRATAYDNTMIAFIDEGLATGVGSSAPGILVSVPIEISSMVYVTYRANLVPSGSGTRIVLSAGILNESGAVMAQAASGLDVDPGEMQMHSEMGGVLGKAWLRLEYIAARLSGKPYTPPAPSPLIACVFDNQESADAFADGLRRRGVQYATVGVEGEYEVRPARGEAACPDDAITKELGD